MAFGAGRAGRLEFVEDVAQHEAQATLACEDAFAAKKRAFAHQDADDPMGLGLTLDLYGHLVFLREGVGVDPLVDQNEAARMDDETCEELFVVAPYEWTAAHPEADRMKLVDRVLDESRHRSFEVLLRLESRVARAELVHAFRRPVV